jgi:DmsE family decaheme c-type cytochrome
MHGSVGVGAGGCVWLLGAAAKYNNRIKILRKLSALAMGGAVAGMLFGFGTAKAAEPNVASDSFSALRGYAQTIAAAPLQSAGAPARNVASSQTNDDSYSTLRSFVQQIGVGQPQSLKGQSKLAANSLFDALREMGQKQKAPVQPKAPAPATARHPHHPAVQASYVGNKVCLGCHTSQATTFEHTLMGRLLKQGKLQCESCHGPGSEHARLGGGRGVGGIISFRKDDLSRTAEENNSICLGCHERGDRTYWQGSPHQTRGLACTNCHTIMKAVSRKHQLKTAFEPDTCFQCHKDRRAQMFRSSHMPMREGKMVCSDCHNPHGSFTDAMLRTASINDTCYKCHAEKRGPFLFEHEPVRENCLNCHDPHGSVNLYLLKLARPRLCNECHSLMDFKAAPGGDSPHHALGQACQNCHVKVHGSNSPGGAFFFR